MKKNNNGIISGLVRRYKTWRDRKLRMRIILNIQSHSKYDPGERGLICAADELICYINNGMFVSERSHLKTPCDPQN